ncbi:hypothetical protein R6Z07M_019659 [Ovis aries]
MCSQEGDDYRLLKEYANGFMVSQVLFAACELGVFELLAEALEPLDSAAVSSRLGSSPRGTELLLDTCVSLKLLQAAVRGGKGQGVGYEESLPRRVSPAFLRHCRFLRSSGRSGRSLDITASREHPRGARRLLSPVRLSATPWTAARQASLSITISRSLLKFMSIESVMPSNHLILCRPLLLLPSIFPSIRVFSNVSAICIRGPEYWSFSFSISPCSEYSELISLRLDWFHPLWATDSVSHACSTVD